MTTNVIPLGPARDATDQARLRREVGFWLLLPLPPSENDLFVPVKRGKMPKSAKYLAWIDEAGHHLNRAETCVYNEPVEVHFLIRPAQWKNGKFKLKSDGQNFDKALFDLISGKSRHGHGLIPDDSMEWVKYRTARVVEHDDVENAIPPGWCRMVVKPIAKPEDEK